MDVPIRGEAYAGGEPEPVDGVWNARYNSGNYEIVEITSPEGYRLDPTPIKVSFTCPGAQVAWQVVAATQADQPLDKLTIHKTDVGGKELPGAELTVTTLDGEIIDSWVRRGKHRIRWPILEPDAEAQEGTLRYSDEDNEFVYTLHEDAAPDGYLVASDIQFKVERDEDGRITVYTRATIADRWREVDGASVTMVDETAPQPRPPPPHTDAGDNDGHRHRYAAAGPSYPADGRQLPVDRGADGDAGGIVGPCGGDGVAPFPASRTMVPTRSLNPSTRRKTNVSKPEKLRVVLVEPGQYAREVEIGNHAGSQTGGGRRGDRRHLSLEG